MFTLVYYTISCCVSLVVQAGAVHHLQLLVLPLEVRLRAEVLEHLVALRDRMLYNNNIIYYTILYYAMLYYTVIYYTILYYTIQYNTILYYTTLHYTNAILILYYNFFSISSPWYETDIYTYPPINIDGF